MSARLEYEGRFLAEIEDFGIFQSSVSQALAVDIRFTTVSYFQGDAETDLPGYQTRGRFFVVGKTGDILQDQVAALADATGWDGDLSVILQETWQPRSPVQIIVAKEKTDKDRTYYNAVRILRSDWQPTRAGNVNQEDGRRIAARYSSALKSVVSKYRRQQDEKQPPQRRAEEPPPPPQSQPSTEAAPEPAVSTWNEESAWKALERKAGEMGQEDLESVFIDAVRYYGAGKEISELTSKEWAQVGSIDPHSWTPF